MKVLQKIGEFWAFKLIGKVKSRAVDIFENHIRSEVGAESNFNFFTLNAKILECNWV